MFLFFFSVKGRREKRCASEASRHLTVIPITYRFITDDKLQEVLDGKFLKRAEMVVGKWVVYKKSLITLDL